VATQEHRWMGRGLSCLRLVFMGDSTAVPSPLRKKKKSAFSTVGDSSAGFSMELEVVLWTTVVPSPALSTQQHDVLSSLVRDPPDHGPAVLWVIDLDQFGDFSMLWSNVARSFNLWRGPGVIPNNDSTIASVPK